MLRLSKGNILFVFLDNNLQQVLKLCPLPTSFNALIINELDGVYNSTIYGGGVKLDIVKALAAHLSL